MDEDDLDAREQARIRRRDHDAGGEDRELLKPGMGKVFKQILDRQAREAREDREGREERDPRQARDPRDLRDASRGRTERDRRRAR